MACFGIQNSIDSPDCSRVLPPLAEKKQKKNRQEGQSGSAPPARDERAEEETDNPKAKKGNLSRSLIDPVPRLLPWPHDEGHFKGASLWSLVQTDGHGFPVSRAERGGGM